MANKEGALRSVDKLAGCNLILFEEFHEFPEVTNRAIREDERVISEEQVRDLRASSKGLVETPVAAVEQSGQSTAKSFLCEDK